MIRPSFMKTIDCEDMTFWDKIQEAVLFNPVSSSIRRNFNSLRRLIRWTPVIWNQYDWDYEGIYDVLEQKMKDLYKDLKKDVWHDPKEVQKCLKQIQICLKRIAVIKNWTDFYDYPIDDIDWEPTEDGYQRMIHTSEANEKERQRISQRIDNNHKKFWKDFLEWHENWWT